MMLFQEKQQTIICVITTVMVGGFVLFRYLPLRNQTKAIEQTKAIQSLIVGKVIAEAEQLPALKEQLLKLQKTVGNYEAKVPDSQAIGEFLHKIANLMKEHNLTDQLIEPGREIKTENLNWIPVNMRSEGSLKQIFGFFKSLQELERFIRIEQVMLTNDSDFTGRLRQQTRAFIYYRANAEQGQKIRGKI